MIATFTIALFFLIMLTAMSKISSWHFVAGLVVVGLALVAVGV